MTHIKTTKGRKDFIKNQLRKASPMQVKKIYLETEKATNFYNKNKKCKR
jgi:hypothetical protein